MSQGFLLPYGSLQYHRNRGFRGHGAYSYDNPGPVGSFGRRVGAYLGNRFFGAPGREIGNSVGGLAHYLGALAGSGAYRARRKKGRKMKRKNPNKRSALRITQKVPRIASRDNYFEISHMEYISDIITSGTPGAFSSQNYPLQPGSPQTFPWLSSVVGTNYQQYRMMSCVLSFKSFSANALNSTNTALGSVIAAINYDSSDAHYRNRYEMENTDWSNSSAPSENFSVFVECDRNQMAFGGNLFVRHGGVPLNADIKTYDTGRFTIATVGMQGANVNVGSLYASYKMRFYKPVVLAPLSNAYILHIRPLTFLVPSDAFGATRTILENNLNATVSSTTITLDRSYLRQGMRFCLTQSGSGAPDLQWGTLTLTGLQGVGILNNGTLSTFVVSNGAGNSQRVSFFQVTEAGTLANPTIVAGAGVIPATPGWADALLLQINPGN